MNAPNPVAAEPPTKATASDLLKMHGPTGYLIRKLQRYALLGWGLFFATLLFHFLVVLVSTLAPRPVVVVDPAGNKIGNIEFLGTSTRSDQELLAAAMRFMRNYQSLNSDTIYEDYAEAMNAMSKELEAATKEALKRDNYLARVAKAKTRSWIEFGIGAQAPALVDKRDLEATVRLRGNLIAEGEGGRVEKPFDTTLVLHTVPRTTQNTAGIQIISRKDN
jgi:hypothetical protein